MGTRKCWRCSRWRCRAAISPTWLTARAREVQLLWNRKPIDRVLAKPDLSSEVRAKLEMVLQVRHFAAYRLGLNVGGAYKSVSPVDQSAVTWVLMAAEPDRLTPCTWYFPIVGAVPYKGYFNKAAAQAAAVRSKRRGWTPIIRPAVAFSSLGYFNDPLLSNLLGLDRVVLAGVIIHELFHRTYFLAGNVMFDESTANYVAAEGRWRSSTISRGQFRGGRASARGARQRHEIRGISRARGEPFAGTSITAVSPANRSSNAGRSCSRPSSRITSSSSRNYLEWSASTWTRSN